jgi:hypothetical protein
MNGRAEECIQIFIGKPEGKRLLGRPRRRWEDIRTALKEHLAQDRVHWQALLNMIMNPWIP